MQTQGRGRSKRVDAGKLPLRTRSLVRKHPALSTPRTVCRVASGIGGAEAVAQTGEPLGVDRADRKDAVQQRTLDSKAAGHANDWQAWNYLCAASWLRVLSWASARVSRLRGSCSPASPLGAKMTNTIMIPPTAIRL